MVFSSLAAFTVSALLPGYEYAGPSGKGKADDNLCECNTVTYSLLSACDACQSETWITYGFIVSLRAFRNVYTIRWSEYSFNCTKTLPPST